MKVIECDKRPTPSGYTKEGYAYYRLDDMPDDCAFCKRPIALHEPVSKNRRNRWR